ncbi:lysozyme inhibitor LprI family protein [Allorhizobium pseudoryzae]|uniref:lysozyme inhibitor LprI family protein n=1 Tax=Allorhizobium pseudoryzae TaxID=379684 RepID=UPI003CFBE277
MNSITVRATALSLLVAAAATLSAPVSTAQAASFDCDGTDLAADEKVICEDRSLNDLDVKMATTFELLTGLMPMGNRDILRDDQSAWLKKRQACGADAECLRQAYTVRMEQLQEAYKGLIKPL